MRHHTGHRWLCLWLVLTPRHQRKSLRRVRAWVVTKGTLRGVGIGRDGASAIVHWYIPPHER